MKEKISFRKRHQTVPIFFAADDKYTKYMIVSMKSVIANTSKKHQYRLYVLHTDITPENQAMVKRLETSNCKIDFVDVTE